MNRLRALALVLAALLALVATGAPASVRSLLREDSNKLLEERDAASEPAHDDALEAATPVPREAETRLRSSLPRTRDRVVARERANAPPDDRPTRSAPLRC